MIVVTTANFVVGATCWKFQ